MAQNTLTYRELEARWKALRPAGVRVREVACVGASRTLLCAEYGDGDAPAIHLSAGAHGDEPAGVLALLEFAEERAFDPRYSYRMWPCTNPTGFAAGTRVSADGADINRTFGRGGGSPEAKAIVIANRDRKFRLAVDLHEDDEATGFYVYAYGEAGAGERVVDAVEEAGTAIDPRRCVRPDPGREAEAIGGLSLSLLLRRGAAADVLTFETPAAAPLEARIATHRLALAAILRLL